MDKYIGKVLDGRYEIISLIGVGGMSYVYKARCRRLSRYVAVKILKEELACDKEFEKRFKNESNAVARMSHKNIVNVFDVSINSEIDYIVMEWIEGISLKEYLSKKGKLDYKQTIFFGHQIAEALAHAHSKGIIHQDIKPHNLMLLRDGTLKVADFGIAKLENDGETKVIKEAIGSVHYISPEQAKGSHIDGRTDIYSLGVVMYEMITGQTPFQGDNAVSIVMQHLNALPAPPSSLNENIPKSLENVILKAMNPSLKNRYKSPFEVLTDLDKIKSNPNVMIEKSTQTSEEFTKPISIISSENTDNYDDEYDDEYTEPRRNKKAIFVAICIVTAIFVGSIIFAFSNVFLKSSKPIYAPNLINLTVESIEQDATYNDFNIEVREQIYSENEIGTILDQNPKPDEKITESTIIYLTVSKGVKKEILPDIVALDYEQAKIELNKLELKFNEEFEYSDTITEGKIIKTEPKAGEEVDSNVQITIYISSGAEVKLTTVPNLKGLTKAQAQESLKKANLALGTVTEEVSSQAVGTVISQGVEQGVDILSGTKVSIVIAKADDSIKETTKDIEIEIPKLINKDEVLMEVFAGSERIHAMSHSVTEGTFTVSVKGTGTVTLYVYADDELIKERVVKF